MYAMLRGDATLKEATCVLCGALEAVVMVVQQ